MPCQYCPHCQELAKTKKNPQYLDIQEIWEYGVQHGFTTVKQNFNRFAISRLIKKHGKERVKEFITYSQKIKNESYAPQVYNFMDLEEKLGRILDFKSRTAPIEEDNSPKIVSWNKLPDGTMQPIYEKQKETSNPEHSVLQSSNQNNG